MFIQLSTFLLFTSSLLGAPPTSSPGCWDALVRPGQQWVLHESDPEPGEGWQITVTTSDVHVVGSARVATLRWSAGPIGGAATPFDGAVMAQVILTDRGVWLLEEPLDDGAALSLCETRPGFANPPRAGARDERLTVSLSGSRKGPLVCVGDYPAKDAEPCDSVCYGEVCISPNDGIVSVEGTFAPKMAMFAQKGYAVDERRSDGTTCATSMDCPGAKLCFQNRCVARKEIACPASAPGCPPTYWRMYWYLEKLCHDRFTADMFGLLKKGRETGESTGEDLAFVAAFGDALRGVAIPSPAVRGFYTDPAAATWLPHPCAASIGRWKTTPLTASMQGWLNALAELK